MSMGILGWSAVGRFRITICMNRLLVQARVSTSSLDRYWQLSRTSSVGRLSIMPEFSDDNLENWTIKEHKIEEKWSNEQAKNVEFIWISARVERKFSHERKRERVPLSLLHSRFLSIFFIVRLIFGNTDTELGEEKGMRSWRRERHFLIRKFLSSDFQLPTILQRLLQIAFFIIHVLQLQPCVSYFLIEIRISFDHLSFMWFTHPFIARFEDEATMDCLCCVCLPVAVAVSLSLPRPFAGQPAHAGHLHWDAHAQAQCRKSKRGTVIAHAEISVHSDIQHIQLKAHTRKTICQSLHLSPIQASALWVNNSFSIFSTNWWGCRSRVEQALKCKSACSVRISSTSNSMFAYLSVFKIWSFDITLIIY